MGTVSRASAPPDPDPSPVMRTNPAEQQGVAREARKKEAKAYGRSKTILASGEMGAASTNGQKTNILGG